VNNTKRINHNLLRKETSFLCYSSSVLIQIDFSHDVYIKKPDNGFDENCQTAFAGYK